MCYEFADGVWGMLPAMFPSKISVHAFGLRLQSLGQQGVMVTTKETKVTTAKQVWSAASVT